MQSPEASTAATPTQIYLALAAVADEIVGTLARLFAYVGTLLLFAILGYVFYSLTATLPEVPPQDRPLSWLLFVIRPEWSYRLNADFEDHAEHEYMAFVGEHPEWETEAFESAFATDYAELDSVADLFRQIGYDERVHKQESLARMREPRFH